MEECLIYSNGLHLIDQEKIHQATEQIVESLNMATGSTFGLDFYRVVETYFEDLDKWGEVNHLLGIIDNTCSPTEDLRVR